MKSEQNDILLMIDRSPLFAALEENVRRTLAKLGMVRLLTAGETLFLKNEAADALYAVARGEICICTSTDDGHQLTLNLLGAGDVFGEVALLDGQPRTADAVATEATELLMIRRRDFLDMLSDQPKIAIAMIEILCQRVRWMSSRMEETNFLPVSARVARRLADLADSYGDQIMTTQDQLAVFANTSRETVNRQLRVWKREGLIELGRNRIRLLDRQALDIVARLEIGQI